MFSNRCKRLDQFGTQFDKGDIYCSDDGQLIDLSDLTVCNIAVDTVRQLYKGTVRFQPELALRKLIESDLSILDKHQVDTNFSWLNKKIKTIPCDFKIAKMGKASGYRYRLQNNQEGIIVLLGSFNQKLEKEYSHLKIELSPHFIAKRTPEQVQKYLDEIAKTFLKDSIQSGVAIHQCVDVQGWEIPQHMVDNIQTRSKRIKEYRGISQIQFNGLQDVISTYNRTETITIGSPTALQTSIYRKDLEIVKSDKVDYYHDLWDSFTMGNFNPEKPVTRIEIRTHHNIIKDFGRGIGEELNSYLQIHKYLNNLWKYSLNNIRYTLKNNVHPLWQYLHDDVTFNDKFDFRQSEFKRKQEEKTDITAVKRNIGLLMGNLASMQARNDRDLDKIVKEIKACPSIYDIISLYLLEENLDEDVYFEGFIQKVKDKRLCSKFAMAG